MIHLVELDYAGTYYMIGAYEGEGNPSHLWSDFAECGGLNMLGEDPVDTVQRRFGSFIENHGFKKVELRRVRVG